MFSRLKLGVAAAALLAATAVAGASQAAVFIGLQEAGVNGGAIKTVASGLNTAIYNAAYGTFELELLTGSSSVAPTILGSTTSDHNIKGKGGTLNIYVTRNNITGPIPNRFVSSFTSNVLPKGWSVNESTYVSTSNALYTGTLLSSHAFTTIGVFEHENTFTAGLTGPYSVTTRYTLNAPTLGSSFSTIAIQDASVPEPAAWSLMILGFGSAGAMLRAHRRRLAAA